MIRISNPILHFDYEDGTPMAGGWLFTYIAGTSTPVSTFADKYGESRNATQIMLDSRGECSVFLDPSVSYKFIVYTPDKMRVVQEADDVCLYPEDSICVSSIKDKMKIVHDEEYFTEEVVGDQLVVSVNPESVIGKQGEQGVKGEKGDKGDKGDGLKIDKYVPTVVSLTDGTQGMPAENAVWFVNEDGHMYGCSSRNPLTWVDMGAIGTMDTVPVDKITGILPISKGGTSASTAKGASYNILHDMSLNEEDINDNYTNFVFKYNTPNEGSGSVYYRTSNKVWNWIKSRIQSVLGLTASTYGGKASSASNADAATIANESRTPQLGNSTSKFDFNSTLLFVNAGCNNGQTKFFKCHSDYSVNAPFSEWGVYILCSFGNAWGLVIAISTTTKKIYKRWLKGGTWESWIVFDENAKNADTADMATLAKRATLDEKYENIHDGILYAKHMDVATTRLLVQPAYESGDYLRYDLTPEQGGVYIVEPTTSFFEIRVGDVKNVKNGMSFYVLVNSSVAKTIRFYSYSIRSSSSVDQKVYNFNLDSGNGYTYKLFKFTYANFNESTHLRSVLTMTPLVGG